MLAMEVNDDAGSLTPRGALRFFVGTPPGACSLLRGPPRWAIPGPARLNGIHAGLPTAQNLHSASRWGKKIKSQSKARRP
jgi:hypothetical protein